MTYIFFLGFLSMFKKLPHALSFGDAHKPIPDNEPPMHTQLPLQGMCFDTQLSDTAIQSASSQGNVARADASHVKTSM